MFMLDLQVTSYDGNIFPTSRLILYCVVFYSISICKKNNDEIIDSRAYPVINKKIVLNLIVIKGIRIMVTN